MPFEGIQRYSEELKSGFRMGIPRFSLDAECAKTHFTSSAGLEIEVRLQPREESAHLGD